MSQPNTQGRSFGRIAGGSEQDAVMHQGSGIGFFKSGVKYRMPTQRKSMMGRILPARDQTLSPQDSAYAASVVPYRDMLGGRIDEETKTQAFNAWYFQFKGHKFFGRIMANITSPATLRGLSGISVSETADPIEDCYRYAKGHKDKQISDYTVKPTDEKKGAIISRPSGLVAFNMFCQEEGRQWDTQIIVTAAGALEHLKKQLAWPTRYGDQPLDPNFPMFLLGDITHPQNGLVCRLQMIPLGTISVIGFVITQQEFMSTGAQSMPVPAQALLDRYDIFSDQVMRIDTYQEIVDLIVVDGSIPYEIIQAACGHMANIPPRSNNGSTTISSPPTNAQVNLPPGGDWNSNPPAYQPEMRPAGGPPNMPVGGQTTALPGSGQTTPVPASAGWGTPSQPAGGFGAPPTQHQRYDHASGYPLNPDGTAMVPPSQQQASSPTPPQQVPPPPPQQQVPPSQQQAPPPQPAPPTKPLREFWVVQGGVTVSMDENAVQARVDAGTSTFDICSKEQGSPWTTPSALGFNPRPGAGPAPAAPQPQQSAPQQPASYQQPQTPAAAPAGQGGPGLLSPEEYAEFMELRDRASQGPAHPKGAFKEGDFPRMLELTHKMSGNNGRA